MFRSRDPARRVAEGVNVLVDGTGAGWRIACRAAINNRGEIVGTGTTNGQSRAFL